MRRITSRIRSSAALAGALALGSSITAAPPIVSTFSMNAEGWTIADLNCSNYTQIIGGGTISWIASGGAPGGFLRSTDPTGNCYSYESPSVFEGDKSAYLGGALRWRIRTNVADWLPGSVLILIGGGNVLVADVPQPTTNTWLGYSVPLTAASFRLNSAGGPAVSPAQMQATLANLASIRISAEFGSEQGEETVDIDSIALVTACAADLDGDGQVGATDLGILLGAWGSENLLADIDGDTAIDAGDLAVLLGAWGPCP